MAGQCVRIKGMAGMDMHLKDNTAAMQPRLNNSSCYNWPAASNSRVLMWLKPASV